MKLELGHIIMFNFDTFWKKHLEKYTHFHKLIALCIMMSAQQS